MSIVIANLLSLIILALFIALRFVREKSILDPGIIFALNLIILYPIRGFALYIFGSGALPDFPGAEVEQNLEFASWLSVLGAIGFVSGYLAIIQRRRLSILHGLGEGSDRYALLSCTALSLLAFVGLVYKVGTGDYMSYLISEDRIAGLTQIGNLLLSLEWPAFIGVWVLWFNGMRSKPFLTLFICVNVIVIPFQFLQGSKTFLSLLMVSIFVAYYWARRHVPKIFAIISVAIVVTVVFPFVHSFRDYINTEYGKIPSFSTLDIQAILAAREADKKTHSGSTVVDEVAQVSARYSGMDQLYGMTQYVPSKLPLRHGFGYTAVIVNVIPRFFWPNKPIYSRGAAYGKALGTITSVTPFPYGEAYWDFGEVGVLIMMFVWGACLAFVVRLYERFFRKQNISFVVGLYFLSRIYWMAGGESSMPSVLSGLPQEIALLAVIIFVLQLLIRLRSRLAVGIWI